MLLWDKYPLRSGQWYYAKLGPLAVWLSRDERRYRYGYKYVGSDEYSRECLFVETSVVPEDVQFLQVLAEKPQPELSFRPALPARPVLVNLGAPVRLLPGSEIDLFVSIPLWFQAVLEGGRILFDIPSVVLPNIWFGGLSTGKLGYSLNGFFAWRREDVFLLPNVIVCPLKVKNASRSEFLPTRVAILADNLPVFLKPLDREGGEGPEAFLLTAEARAEFQGNDEVDLEVLDRLPPQLSGARLLTEPRATGENILRKGLFLLRKSSNF